MATLTQDFDLSQLSSNNILDGGAGNDFLSATGRVNRWSDYEDGPGVLTNRLTGGTGNDTLQASAFVDDLGSGGSAVNVLLANDGNDTLVATIQAGMLGSNRLFGHNGNDRLQVNGGEGNLLNAGQGRDVLDRRLRRGHVRRRRRHRHVRLLVRGGRRGRDHGLRARRSDRGHRPCRSGRAWPVERPGGRRRHGHASIAGRPRRRLVSTMAQRSGFTSSESPAPSNSITDFITAGQILDADLFV